MIGKWKEGLKNAGLQLQFNLFYIGMLMFLVPAITVFCYWQSQKILCEVVTSDIRNLVEKSNQSSIPFISWRTRMPRGFCGRLKAARIFPGCIFWMGN